MTDVHADIDALKGLRDALVRYRLGQRDAAARGNLEIEKTRASLEAKAGRWQARLEQRRAALDRCHQAQAAAAAAARGGPPIPGLPGFSRSGHGYGLGPDCSGLARDVEEAEEQLKHVREWQRRVDREADAFRTTASRFQYLIDYDIPRAERRVRDLITGLEAIRRTQIPGS